MQSEQHVELRGFKRFKGEMNGAILRPRIILTRDAVWTEVIL